MERTEDTSTDGKTVPKGKYPTKRNVQSMRNFQTSGKDDHLSAIISKLKFISKIRVGEKIDVKNMKIIKPTIAHRLYRSIISRESKENTYDFLKDTFNVALEMIYYYSESLSSSYNTTGSLDKDALTVLKENLHDALHGAQRLTETYIDQTKFVCDLETLIQNVQLRNT